MADPPDAVLVTGDLAEHRADSEYALVKSTLARLDAPAYVLAGNHDDRGRLRHHFELSGHADEPVHYAVDLGPLRLLTLDTSKPGVAAGDLGQEQLAWLDSQLAAGPTTPTVLAMHHPPFQTGMPAWDEIGLRAEDRSALADGVRRHSQVRAIVAGHVHRAIVSEVAGRVALTAPSTYVQGRPRFDDRSAVHRRCARVHDPHAPGRRTCLVRSNLRPGCARLTKWREQLHIRRRLAREGAASLCSDAPCALTRARHPEERKNLVGCEMSALDRPFHPK